MTLAAPVHDRLATLADPTRGRILLALDQHELTVTELCAVLALPQSTVSRHLRVLSDDQWVTTRQEGTSRYYTRNVALETGADRLWVLVSADLRSADAWGTDSARLSDVLAQRRQTSRAWFERAGDEWDGIRSSMFGGAAWSALPALLDEQLVIGDLGCGTGHVSELLAPWVRGIVAVDASSAMLSRATQRLRGAGNVEFRLGELEALPVRDGELDAAVLSLVLHYAADPPRVLAETNRVLRRGGRLLVVDMLPHGRVEFRQQMGHVWLGFPEGQMRSWLAESGCTDVRIRPLPADPAHTGPTLFTAVARKA